MDAGSHAKAGGSRWHEVAGISQEFTAYVALLELSINYTFKSIFSARIERALERTSHRMQLFVTLSVLKITARLGWTRERNGGATPEPGCLWVARRINWQFRAATLKRRRLPNHRNHYCNGRGNLLIYLCQRQLRSQWFIDAGRAARARDKSPRLPVRAIFAPLQNEMQESSCLNQGGCTAKPPYVPDRARRISHVDASKSHPDYSVSRNRVARGSPTNLRNWKR